MDNLSGCVHLHSYCSGVDICIRASGTDRGEAMAGDLK